MNIDRGIFNCKQGKCAVEGFDLCVDCAKKRAKKLPQALPPIQSLQISVFDPNTRVTDKIDVPVIYEPDSDLIHKLCAQSYIT